MLDTAQHINLGDASSCMQAQLALLAASCTSGPEGNGKGGARISGLSDDLPTSCI